MLTSNGDRSTPSSLPAPTKTAIITGASSGIGLALSHHLLSLQPPSSPVVWRVILADVSPPPCSLTDAYGSTDSSGDGRAHYHRTDVSSWADTRSLFRKAYALSGGKIDFFAANAGIDDRESVYAADDDLDDDNEDGPREPNLKTLDVDLKSVFFGLKCFLHFARRTRRALSSDANANAHTSRPDSSEFQPSMVVTASCVALYRFPTNPQYCAAKAGLVALVRSVAERLFADDGLAVNAILPAFVPTNLAPKGLVERWPREHVTPMETVLRAYGELIPLNVDVGLEIGERKRGECVECVRGELFYREQVAYPCESQRWMVEDEGGFWGVGYGGGGSGKKRKRGGGEEGEDGKNGIGEKRGKVDG